MFAVHSGDQSLLVLGDTAQHPAVFARHPDWQAAFDIDGDAAVATRKKLFDRAAADRMLVTGYHFPFPACGHLIKIAGGYEHVPVPVAADALMRNVSRPGTPAPPQGEGGMIGGRLFGPASLIPAAYIVRFRARQLAPRAAGTTMVRLADERRAHRTPASRYVRSGARPHHWFPRPGPQAIPSGRRLHGLVGLDHLAGLGRCLEVAVTWTTCWAT